MNERGRRRENLKPRDRTPWQAVPLVFVLLIGMLLVYITGSYYENKAEPEATQRIGSDRISEEP